MNSKEYEKFLQRQNIDYSCLGLKKTYYEPGETPQERLRNLLSPTTNLAAIVTKEGKTNFENLTKDKRLQDLIVGNAVIVSDQFQDIQDYLHDIPIFYKYFDQEGNPKNFKIWLKKTYNSFFS